MSVTSVAPANASITCTHDGATATSVGAYFKLVLSDAFGWNPLGLNNIPAFLAYWWDLTGGTNNAQTVDDFIARDCSH